MAIVNGQQIPDNLTLAELKGLMQSNDMQSFCLACEALRNRNTQEAYQILKASIDSKDKFKRRYILSVIFEYEEAVEWMPYLIEALHSEEHFMVTTALKILVSGKMQVSEQEIKICLEKNQQWLDPYDFQLLGRLGKTEENTEYIIRLFYSAKTDSVRIAVAEELENFATTENYERLFKIMCNDRVSKLRMAACRIANQFQRKDWLQRYAQDSDGHIRNYVLRAINVSQGVD